MSIIVNHISKNFGNLKVLQDLSFSIESGQIVGLLGPNGAGKSTLMRILSCLIPASSGNVIVNGFDANNQSLEVRKSLGYLPENNPLYSEMYVKEYLEFSAGFYKFECKKSRIEEMIEITGLKNHLSKQIGLLSKGLKQRVGLSQVLLHDPQVLILDEPTSGLDPNQILEIRDLILSLSKDKTILFSSHIMQEVENLCERVIILDEGKIVTDDKISEMSRGVNRILISVTFNSAVDENLILSMDKVKSVSNISENEWLIESKSGYDIREDLMSFALQNSLTIFSLSQQTENLEAVFRKLTRKA